MTDKLMFFYLKRYLHSDRKEDELVSVHRGIGDNDKANSIIESIKSLRLSQYFGNKETSSDRLTSDNQGLLRVPVDDDDVEMTMIHDSTKIIF